MAEERTRAYSRFKDWRKALHKQYICRHHYGWEYYDNLHQYSKNKIHCSCPLCRAKEQLAKNSMKRYKFSEHRKIARMYEEEKEYYEREV